MKKKLFLINTHFQLITSLQIIDKENIKHVDFIITNNLNGYKEIIKRLNKLKFVDTVYAAEIKNFTIPKNNFQRLKNMKDVLIGSKSISKFLKNFNGRGYDNLYFYNLDFFTYILYDFVRKESQNITVNRFEEGFSIYLSFVCKKKSEKLCDIIASLFNRFSVKEDIENVFLYHPEFLTYDLNYNIKTIPLLSKKDKKFKELINYVFNYNGEQLLETNSIIFEECFYTDSGFMDDVPLFYKICEMIGFKNVSIKLHPRNKIDRFSKLGIRVMKNSSIPWEVIQINNDFSDKTFITITSGSVLASMLYFGENIKTIFLYKLLDEKFSLKEHYEEYLMKLVNVSNSQVYIPENINNLMEIVGEKDG